MWEGTGYWDWIWSKLGVQVWIKYDQDISYACMEFLKNECVLGGDWGGTEEDVGNRPTLVRSAFLPSMINVQAQVREISSKERSFIE